jgi:hypothetical protein
VVATGHLHRMVCALQCIQGTPRDFRHRAVLGDTTWLGCRGSGVDDERVRMTKADDVQLGLGMLRLKLRRGSTNNCHCMHTAYNFFIRGECQRNSSST